MVRFGEMSTTWRYPGAMARQPAQRQRDAPRPDGVRWLSEDELVAWRRWTMLGLQLNGLLGRQLAGSPLSYQDYTVLAYLTEQPGDRGRLGVMGVALGWEKSRISHHVTRMEDRGLVIKEKCDHDRRGWFVRVTPAGRQAIEDAAPGHVRAVREHFIDQLTPAQLAALSEASAVVLDHLASLEG